MLIRADIAMIIHNRESGFGSGTLTPKVVNHQKVLTTTVLRRTKSKDPAMIFCTTNSTFSEREKVAIK